MGVPGAKRRKGDYSLLVTKEGGKGMSGTVINRLFDALQALKDAEALMVDETSIPEFEKMDDLHSWIDSALNDVEFALMGLRGMKDNL